MSIIAKAKRNMIYPEYTLYRVFYEGDMGICGAAVLMLFQCGDVVNKISTCGVALISSHTVCDVCIFQAAVFGELNLP